MLHQPRLLSMCNLKPIRTRTPIHSFYCSINTLTDMKSINASGTPAHSMPVPKNNHLRRPVSRQPPYSQQEGAGRSRLFGTR